MKLILIAVVSFAIGAAMMAASIKVIPPPSHRGHTSYVPTNKAAYQKGFQACQEQF